MARWWAGKEGCVRPEGRQEELWGWVEVLLSAPQQCLETRAALSAVWLGPRQTHRYTVLLFNYSDANLTAYKLGMKTLGLNFWLSATLTAVLPLLVNIFTNFQQLPPSPVFLIVSKYICSIFIPSCFPCKLCTLCPPPSRSFGSSAL